MSIQSLCCILAFLAILLPAAAMGGEASVRETTLEIPTYAMGPEDRNPPLWNANVYPYPMQTDVTRDKSVQRHRAVVMENDYIRVIVLPDLGGRIYAAEDKTNGDFDFIYHNHVIKPGLVALRGAWLSGGIEWNFPTRGHTVNTVSPVKYTITRNEQSGTVTCTVGTSEWVRRMHWSVAITVPADSSRFTYRVSLQNPTLTHNNAYFWANAAVHAWDETRVTFPPAEYTFAGRRANPQPWPIAHGKDVSWYKNTPNPYDYFCGTPGDFQGAYNHQRDNGTVHTANRYDSMGRKFWTWGTAPDGMIWERILTDNDGQYIEVQSGRLLTQGDTWIFEPHMAETWEEGWYPIKKMKGLVIANANAALNFVVGEESALVALNTTRRFSDATVQVLADGKEIFDEKITLSPAGAWQTQIPLKNKAKVYRVIVRDVNGQQIIAYSPADKPQIPSPELEPDMPPDAQCTAEQLYLKGYYAAKHWQGEAAIGYYEKALKADPGFTPALRAMAIHFYKTGRWQQALEYANKALQRNDDDLDARYYRVLAKLKLRIEERTEEDLELIGRRAAYRHIAPYLRASVVAGRKDYAEAIRLMRLAIAAGSNDDRARTMEAALLRNAAQYEQGRAAVDAALAADPLNPLAIVEKAIGGRPESLDLLTNDPQEYIEAACAYAEMNLWRDAAAALKLYESRPGARPHPFVYFHLGYIAERMIQPQEAAEYFAKGLKLPADYVFPFRTEDYAVLNAALRENASAWQLHYYLGVLMSASSRWQEGLEQFKAAAATSPSFAPLYWCMGEIYREKLHDLSQAQAAYEKALAINPSDCAYALALDSIYAARKLRAERDKLYSSASPGLQKDYRFMLKKAGWDLDAGRYDEAIKTLRGTHFHPWEGWTGAHEVYVRALRARAQREMEQRRYPQAIGDLRAAMEYPENLGSGRPNWADFSYEFYQIGLCQVALGKADLAREAFGKVSRNSPWYAKAAEELKKLKE